MMMALQEQLANTVNWHKCLSGPPVLAASSVPSRPIDVLKSLHCVCRIILFVFGCIASQTLLHREFAIDRQNKHTGANALNTGPRMHLDNQYNELSISRKGKF
jgi:hypothetical protein